MKTIRTEITIQASASTVWNVLTDFDAFKDWNPFMIQASGTAAKGEALNVQMQLGSGKPMTFKPVVRVCEQDKALVWLGSTFVRGLFDGEHHFYIEQIDKQTLRFVQEERFSGILAAPIMGMIRKKTIAGFTAMNEALKTRAESIEQHNHKSQAS